ITFIMACVKQFPKNHLQHDYACGTVRSGYSVYFIHPCLLAKIIHGFSGCLKALPVRGIRHCEPCHSTARNDDINFSLKQ
ncbi:MAG: hypothetical protein IKZ88_01375, partial [Neisseriaceae bacterium]|nr:hypothetical protein [Neisseriaceae bacterium]